MSPKLDYLDRMSPLVPGPERPLESFHRLRQRRRRNERIRAGVLGLGLVLAGVLLAAKAMETRDRTADHPIPPPTESLRLHDGELLQAKGDLLAIDPETGQSRVVVNFDFLETPRIGNAAWSADGRWVAYDVVVGSSLWVASAEESPRRLTRDPGSWAWSPTVARLALMRNSRLSVIDAASGGKTDLGSTFADDDVTGPVWSPDGERILFGVRGGTVYSIDAASGKRSVFVHLPGSLDLIDGNEWSPDGAHVAVLVAPDVGSARLYVTDADGSNARFLIDGIEPHSGAGVWLSGDPSQGTEWSPDGTRLTYVTFSAPNDRRLQIWTVSLDDSRPHLVVSKLNDTCCIDAGGPAWSPDGSQIGFQVDGNSFATDVDGAGEPRSIDELSYLSWRLIGGWYFCGCYG
jgi:Tol biopolymer transport system component